MTPSRLHITLIDLNASLGRMDGGVGITLDDPRMILVAEEDDEIIISASASSASGDDLFFAECMRRSAEAVLPHGMGLRIDLQQIYPAHVGLGSGTQISLATGMAVNLLYDLDLSVREIAKMVGRGGTSGIGVAAFEEGGFILDGGHSSSEKDFSPSSASRAPPPPVLMRRDFPDWGIVLAIPRLKGAHSVKEVKIFQNECPIPLREVQALSHIILMKMLPSIVEEDIVGFGESINEVQKVGFKRREVGIQDPMIKEIIEEMIDCGAYGAGMSSFGPIVYCITEDPTGIEKMVRGMLDDGETMIVKARNEGALKKFK